MDELADVEMADEAEMPDGDMPMEPPAPPPHSEADPNYAVYRRPNSTRKSTPRTWPNRRNSNACAPISTSSSSR